MHLNPVAHLGAGQDDDQVFFFMNPVTATGPA